MSSFLYDYVELVGVVPQEDYTDNYDFESFGPEVRKPGSWKAYLKSLTKVFGVRLERLNSITPTKENNFFLRGLEFVRPNLANLEWLYDHLSDDESRAILVNLAAYRALGYRKIKLPLNNPDYLNLRNKLAKLPHGSESIDVHFQGWKLHQRNLQSIGYPIEVFSGKHAFMETFAQEQYRCRTPGGDIGCANGDVVIDAGGCYGDTALYFASKAGRNGRVFVFEFLPENLKILRRNLDLNPTLRDTVSIFERPVWSESNELLFVEGNGPATVVSPKPKGPGAMAVKTMRIDDLMEQGIVDRVDFIKMDIEGAEPDAIKGAAQVLRKFHPKLAITVYHSFSHFWEIPKILDDLGLNYEYYLRHFTMHAGETVLFAKPLKAS